MQGDQNEHRGVPFTHTCSVCDYYRQDLHRRLEYGMIMAKSEVKHKSYSSFIPAGNLMKQFERAALQ